MGKVEIAAPLRSKQRAARAVILTATTLALTLPTAVLAQTADPVAPPPGAPPQAQTPAVATAAEPAAQAENQGVSALDIVVTARRKDERLQEVPLTVSAFGAGDLLRQGVQNLRDLNNFSPGLNFQVGNPRGGTGRLFMRGLSGGTVGAAKASVFVDGIYLTGDITSVTPAVLERIEVLPGPQSAQFGRATFAGAINYVTRDPGREWGGFASADIATLGNESFNVFVGGPIINDRILFGVSASSQHFEGDPDWRNAPDALHPNGVKLGENLTRSVGARLVFLPTDDLKITLRHDRYREKDSPPVVVTLSPLLRNTVFTKPNGTTSSYFTGTVDSFDGKGLDAQYNLDNLTDPGQRINGARSSAKISWDVAGHSVSLTGAYNTETTTAQSDGDFVYLDNSTSVSRTEREDKQVELRVNSPQDQRFRYQFGGYYLDYDLYSNFLTTNRFRCNTVCVKSNAAAPIGGSITALNVTTPTTTLTNVKSRSVFGAVYFDLSDQITASFEGRYQVETITSNNLLTARVQKGDFKSFLPRVNLQWKVTPDVQVYAVYSVGTNPGGFNTSPFVGEAGSGTTLDQLTYDEDKLYNYEIGLKSQYLNDKLQINASFYHMDWSGMQVTNTYFRTNGAFFGLIGNSGSSHVDGMGIEIVALPVRGLDIRSTISWNKAKYDRYCSVNYFNITGLSNATGNFLNCYFVPGNTLETAPPFSSSVQVGYTREVAGDWDGFIRGVYQYQDGQWESDANFAQSKSANVFNLNVGVQNRSITAQIYCKNCLNEDSPLRFVRLSDVRGGASNAVNNSVGGTPRTPRQIGMSVAYNF